MFEVTAAGRQPIEGAWVGFEGSYDYTSAWTFTDASGRYLLCGLPEDRLTSLFAVKNGYSRDSPYLTVEAGTDTMFDIELKR